MCTDKSAHTCKTHIYVLEYGLFLRLFVCFMQKYNQCFVQEHRTINNKEKKRSQQLHLLKVLLIWSNVKWMVRRQKTKTKTMCWMRERKIQMLLWMTHRNVAACTTASSVGRTTCIDSCLRAITWFTQWDSWERWLRAQVLCNRFQYMLP